MKWLIDYNGIQQQRRAKTTYKVHETFLPEGFLGALNTNPYQQDVAKAKALLAKAGCSERLHGEDGRAQRLRRTARSRRRCRRIWRRAVSRSN
jgi:ABC-type transport system substrate-binding protein